MGKAIIACTAALIVPANAGLKRLLSMHARSPAAVSLRYSESRIPEPALRNHAHAVAIASGNEAIAVVLHLERPARPVRDDAHRGRQTGLDKANG
jgi:hypothetical protein